MVLGMPDARTMRHHRFAERSRERRGPIPLDQYRGMRWHGQPVRVQKVSGNWVVTNHLTPQ